MIANLMLDKVRSSSSTPGDRGFFDGKPTRKTQTEHFKAIDGLRAYMAWWVVCQHLLQASGIIKIYDYPVLKLLTMGGLAVMVFVIISGFVIAHLLLTSEENYGEYIVRRFFRIYPIYLVAILLALALREQYYTFIASAPWAAPSAQVAFMEQQQELPVHIALHVTLLHGLVPNAVLPHSVEAILAPAWSLSLEWQFYLLAPLFVSALFQRGRAAQIAVFVLALIAMSATYAMNPASQWQFPAFLPLTIGFFAAGIMTRFLFGGVPRGMLVLPAILAGLNFAFYAAVSDYGSVLLPFLPLAIWFVVAIFCYRRISDLTSPLDRLFALVLESRAIVNMGRWSYSTYLLHGPIFLVAFAAMHALGISMTEHAAFLALLLACPVIVFLSWASYRLIEAPGNTIGRNLSRRLRKPAPAS